MRARDSRFQDPGRSHSPDVTRVPHSPGNCGNCFLPASSVLQALLPLRMLYSRAQLALMYLGICTLLPYNCLLNVQPYFKEPLVLRLVQASPKRVLDFLRLGQSHRCR